MKNPELLNEGFLDYVFTKNVSLKKTVPLSTTDLSVLTNIYGHLYPRGLYKLLFEEDPQRIETPAGIINTRDLRQFTYMRYLLSPGDYWEPEKKKPAYTDTAYCGGTPLALLGARNKHNVSYNKWHENVNVDDINQVHRLDLFLGHTLASTTIDKETGDITWLKGEGLVRNKYEPRYNAGDILEIRRISNHGMAMYTTKKIPGFDVYNNATSPIRHMMRQTWCWYGTHRSSNMVLCWDDWDYVPKDVNGMTEQLKGYKPKEDHKPTGWGDLL